MLVCDYVSIANNEKRITRNCVKEQIKAAVFIKVLHLHVKIKDGLCVEKLVI